MFAGQITNPTSPHIYPFFLHHKVIPTKTDNAWPAGLLTIFEHGRAKHSTFGPYDKLLNYCFGSGFTFYVALQRPPASDSRDTVDFVVFLVMLNNDGQQISSHVIAF